MSNLFNRIKLTLSKYSHLLFNKETTSSELLFSRFKNYLLKYLITTSNNKSVVLLLMKELPEYTSVIGEVIQNYKSHEYLNYKSSSRVISTEILPQYSSDLKSTIHNIVNKYGLVHYLIVDSCMITGTTISNIYRLLHDELYQFNHLGNYKNKSYYYINALVMFINSDTNYIHWDETSVVKYIYRLKSYKVYLGVGMSNLLWDKLHGSESIGLKDLYSLTYLGKFIQKFITK